MHLLIKYHTDEIREKASLKPAKRGDAGMDLYNASNDKILVPRGGSVLVAAGISVKIPEGFFGLIKARSSTFMKRGLFVVDGVIDSGYTGPLYTVVWNPGLILPNGKMSADSLHIEIEPWERVSQLVLIPHHSNLSITVRELPSTDRGQTGFGSTGR